jgi:hypothetical protein
VQEPFDFALCIEIAARIGEADVRYEQKRRDRRIGEVVIGDRIEKKISGGDENDAKTGKMRLARS